MDMFQYLTVGVTVMLAVERYIAICHPMRARSVCTVKRARIIIILIAFIAAILRAPKFFDISFTDAMGADGKVFKVVVWVEPYNERAYTYAVTICLLTILPLLALVILNTLIIAEIRRSSHFLRTFLGADRRVQTTVTREELKITMMLVAVIMAFFVCNTPYMIYNIMIASMNFDAVDNPMLTKSYRLGYFRFVCHSLLAMRSSCNFVLYCWFSAKFRATFQRVFFPPCALAGGRPYHLAPQGPGADGRSGGCNGGTITRFGFHKNCNGRYMSSSPYVSSFSHTSNTAINRSSTLHYSRETTC